MLKRWIAKCCISLSRFERSERGVAAIEFALLAPPFFLILGAIMETGLMFFAEYTIQTAVQDSARLVRTGQVQGVLSASQFKAKICNLVSVILDCTSGVTVYVRSATNFATLKSTVPDFLTIGPTVGSTQGASACYDTGTTSKPAVVVATYDWKFNMLGMSQLSNISGGTTRRLVGFAIFQNEPFPSSSTSSC
ncbi:TadE/TadG family type IV pilus assembly protein [Aestuariivirga litoralis]|uniref:TadE/TadG family type IV pilus assembly protein n=1 Tax=Aestuariivirga litoralis TaxID=2650924 RepID=UPI0018C4DC9F|nr:TadE/TadG family type IV pilus assembly protein [Aestuariivirga litoralis]MBG1233950.1 pilus assembly protein [Aestuariivirga litoralis]